MARYGVAAAVGSDRTPFPTRQMAVLGELQTTSVLTAPTVAKYNSVVPDMRTNCLHVDLPIRILYGAILPAITQRRANLHVHGHGHIILCIHGMHKWHFLGPTE
jgi:hypothetical protein